MHGTSEQGKGNNGLLCRCDSPAAVLYTPLVSELGEGKQSSARVSVKMVLLSQVEGRFPCQTEAFSWLFREHEC